MDRQRRYIPAVSTFGNALAVGTSDTVDDIIRAFRDLTASERASSITRLDHMVENFSSIGGTDKYTFYLCLHGILVPLEESMRSTNPPLHMQARDRPLGMPTRPQTPAQIRRGNIRLMAAALGAIMILAALNNGGACSAEDPESHAEASPID